MNPNVSARLLGGLLASLGVGGIVGCGPSTAPVTPPPSAEKPAPAGPEHTAESCGGVVCPSGAFCDTRTASKPRCHSQLPYVGRPFGVLAELARTRAWSDA